MTEDEVFEMTGQAYLCLIHPVMNGDTYRGEVAPVLALSSSVPDTLVASMVVGSSWRERLLGLSLAMARRPEAFVDQMLESLRDVRGISIVPACAALAVLARRGLFDADRLRRDTFDRSAFDGEVGWAAECALRYAEGQSVGTNERGPNYGQFFTHQVAVYEWILNGQPSASGNSRPAE